MNWKLSRIDWHSMGNCWTWRKIKKNKYYNGNQVQISWGRIALVFERKNRIMNTKMANVKVDSAMESLDVPRLDRASENPSEVTGSDGPCNPVGYDVQIDPCVGESFEGHAVNVVGGNLRKITEVDRSLS